MSRNGFTLVELMLVVSIIGILLAISTLNFNNWMTRQNIDREVKEMHADIMTMRQRAIATGQNYEVTFPAAGTLVFRRYSSEAEDRGSEGIVVQRKNLRYPVTLSSAGPFEFNERGMTVDESDGFAPVEKILCIFTDANPASDALVITPSRVSMGRIQSQGSKNAAACTKANIEIK